MTNENKINEELERLSDEELDKISGGNGTECPSNKDNSSGKNDDDEFSKFIESRNANIEYPNAKNNSLSKKNQDAFTELLEKDSNSQAREDQRRLQDFYSEIVFGRYIHPQFIPKT